MDYSKYFETVPEGKDSENEFQFDGNGDMNSWLIFMLFKDQWKDKNGRFIDQTDTKSHFINAFLNYHFSKYSGAPEQFFLCLKDLIITIHQHGSITTNPNSIIAHIPGACAYYERLDKLYSPVIEKWIEKNEKGDPNDETIIKKAYIELIFDKYGGNFEGETIDTWCKRFHKRYIKLDPLKIEPEARPGTARLKLVGILASIQIITGNAFDFGKYVKDHFGINDFEVLKNRSKDKKDFIETKNNCQAIMKK